MSNPFLEFNDVSFAHPRSPSVPLIQGMTWSVRPGDFWIVAGGHGSGKSVLLEMAAGLHPILSGNRMIFGQEITGLEGDGFTKTRQRLGLLFGGGGRPFQQMTVTENLSLPLRYHRNQKLEGIAGSVLDWLERLDLIRMAELPLSRLGSAWGQRVALGRALIQDPECLLLDNPLSGLDAAHTRWWRDFLARLHQGMDGLKPVTLVTVVDQLPPWVGLGREFAMMRDGRFTRLGSRADVEASSDPAVRELLQPSY